LKGQDDTWGYNLGLLFHLSDRWKIGVAYRSKFNLEFDGHAKFQLPTILKPFFPNTDISPRMELPSMISTEISARLWEKWTFAMGMLWTGWSVFDELVPKFRNDFLIPPRMRKSPQDWRDVQTFNAGVQYQLNPIWAIRGGYVFDQTPVPEKTLGPMIPDTDGHLLSLGFGYTKDNYVIDMAFMGKIPENRYTRRNIDGFNGKYSSSWFSFTMSYTHTF
jgi:long-chain fatty acid transport protein